MAASGTDRRDRAQHEVAEELSEPAEAPVVIPLLRPERREPGRAPALHVRDVGEGSRRVVCGVADRGPDLWSVGRKSPKSATTAPIVCVSVYWTAIWL